MTADGRLALLDEHLVIPDGTISNLDRVQLLGEYPILWATPTVTAGVKTPIFILRRVSR